MPSERAVVASIDWEERLTMNLFVASKAFAPGSRCRHQRRSRRSVL